METAELSSRQYEYPPSHLPYSAADRLLKAPTSAQCPAPDEEVLRWPRPGCAACSVVEQEPMPSVSWAHIFWSMKVIQRIPGAAIEKQGDETH